MFKLDLEKAEEPEIKLPTSVVSSKKQESSRKTSTSWKILKEMGIPGHVTCLLRNLYASQEATVRTVQKDLHNPDNHDGVITHLEPGILECEVKWALESITTN